MVGRSQYYEGVGNRMIRERLAALLNESGIYYHFVTTGNRDVDLDDQVAIVNAYCRAYGTKNCLLVSIHSNGASSKSANGWEVFTTKGITSSDQYASQLFNEMKAVFPKRKFRTDKKDGDVDKEANFYIIAHSACPAILSENWFHSNEQECRNILMNPKGQYKIALAHFNMIQKAVS